jgi:hypothetical protein
MPDQRPVQLSRYIASTAEKNDALIIAALSQMEEQRKRGKLKPTVAMICDITGLSRNTVRNREWALERLKLLKQRNPKQTSNDQGPKSHEETEDVTIRLRTRITHLLEQNALLYEEILSLRRTLHRKDAEIERLKGRGARHTS